MANAPILRKKRPEGKACLNLVPGKRGYLSERQPVRVTRSARSFLAYQTAGEDLFNALAAALDQDDQHNHRKDGGNYANKCYIIHVNSPFLMSKIFVKTLHYGDGRRAQSHQKQGGENKKYKREDKFDGCL